MDLWQRWIENRKKPHSPGVWVIYFALATLPLFGIGQWAIPAADLAARRSAFHCLLVYVTCAMTLLGTTSFLGIRRYLRQRKLEMPVDMGLAWAGAVAGIMFVILLVASFLPRPKPEYSITHVIGSSDIDRHSPFSFLKKDGVDSPDGGEHDDTSAQASDRTTEHSSSNKALSEEVERSAEGSDESQQGSSDSQSDSSQSSQQESAQSQDAQENSKQESAQSQDAQENSKQESRDPRQQTPDRNVNAPPQSPPQMLKPILDLLGGGIAAVLRLLYWLVVIVVVSYFCWRYAGVILAAVRTFLSDLSSLFGRRESPAEAVGEEAETDSAPPKRRFASFTDPMQGGKSMSDRELVRYTFLALEAWAYEKDCGRTTDETPFEFEKRLAHSFPRMREATAYVVQFYDRLAYASSAPRLSRDRLGQLWEFMRGST
jgi:hypothetical protein